MSNGESRDLFTQRRKGATRRKPDLVCFSHLRWDFVYQRPQHLLSRCAQSRRVFFVEEPIFDGDIARVDVINRQDDLWLVVPHVPPGTEHSRTIAFLTEVINALLVTHHVDEYVAWYYTPMAMEYTRTLSPVAVVYDCMDELSAFRNAPPALRENESLLFARADVVFTGGMSLFESKSSRHPHVHAFPSSIDVAHFGQARIAQPDPADQASIPVPRLGYAGVIDERSDLALIDGIAQARPDWQIIMIGPVVKIDPATLPQRSNIHYLGPKPYNALPSYFSGWNVGLIPFALNDATRFISPTKTPEYLAAGLPVVSTPIRDVVSPYGQQGFVAIATADSFVAAIERTLELHRDDMARARWRAAVDTHLATSSWDTTWEHMEALIDGAVAVNTQRVTPGTHARSVAAAR